MDDPRIQATASPSWDLDQVLDRFEEAWRSGCPPEIGRFLAACGGSTPTTAERQVLVELVMIDLWHRWRRPGAISPPDAASGGSDRPLPERPCLEDYVRRYPQLGPLDDLPPALIAEEYRVRRRRGDRPGREPYLARFPRQAAELQELLSSVDAETPEDTEALQATQPFLRAPAKARAPAEARPEAEPPMPATIGKYHVLASLGKGAQAAAYRAVHPTLAKEVVIKLTHWPVRPGEAQHDQLIAEGRVLAELEHPNLARVYDLDFYEGRPYLVMEYVRGSNLWQHARQQRPGPAEAARLVAAAGRALAAAHARGVVHQDIKPGNLLVDEAGQPRIIDFGLARLRHGWTGDEPQEGGISGTVQYMAPEQARGETDRIDPRSDVFGLGAVLYFLLTGEAPFGGADVRESLSRARRCDFDASALHRPGIPRRLAAICLRAMQADADGRYPTAAAMAVDLERFVRGEARGKTVYAAALGAAVLAIVAGAVWLAVLATGGSGPPAAEEILGRPLRHDFPLSFQMVGARSDASGATTLTEGEQLAFRIEVERDCYVGVWDVSEDGRQIVQLFPNEREPDHLLQAGRPRTVPGEKYAIRVTLTKGLEYVHVIASTEPWQSPAGEKMGPYVVFATPRERARWEPQTRGMKLVDNRSASVSEQVVPLRVVPRKQRTKDEG